MADLSIISHPSPNFGERRNGALPDLVVLHYTAMPTAQAALRRLSDPVHEVSAHYLIGRCGQIWQMVDEDKRAWHAGVGSWAGDSDVNSRSIGIELSNCGGEPFSELLMNALEALLRQIMPKWRIPAEGVIGHSDLAPGRKIDPGNRFDWDRLERQGMARPWREAEKTLISKHGDLPTKARRLGYTADVEVDTLRQAIQLRYPGLKA